MQIAIGYIIVEFFVQGDIVFFSGCRTEAVHFHRNPGDAFEIAPKCRTLGIDLAVKTVRI